MELLEQHISELTISPILSIDSLRTATKVGKCKKETSPTDRQKWKMEWDRNYRDLIKSNNSRIYIIASKNKDNNTIMKIGKSECKGGLRSTFSSYQNGMKGSPSIRTLGINQLIDNELEMGNEVYIYGIWITPIRVSIPGLFDYSEQLICPSIRNVEEKCCLDYRNIYGMYPPWNFQENNKKWPDYILSLYRTQVMNREVIANQEIANQEIANQEIANQEIANQEITNQK